MNLPQMGTHAAADWLCIKVRAYGRPVALFMRDTDGQLFAGELKRAVCPKHARRVGAYGKGLRYRDAVEDMGVLLAEYREEVAA